jgi:hypothetical protein
MHEAVLTGFACPFCDYHGRHLDELRAHVREHPDSVKRLLKILSMFWGPIIFYYVVRKTWPVIGHIFEARISGILRRFYLLDEREAVDYWMRNAEEAEEEEEDRSDGEALINRQASREEENGDQTQVKVRVEERQTYHAPVRRVQRFEAPKIIPPLRPVKPLEISRSLSDEELFRSVEGAPREERRRSVISEYLQASMNRLREILLLEDLQETRGALDALMQEFEKTDGERRLEGNLDPEDQVLLLIAHG